MEFRKRPKSEMTRESVTRRNIETHRVAFLHAISIGNTAKIIEYAGYLTHYENIARDNGWL